MKRLFAAFLFLMMTACTMNPSIDSVSVPATLPDLGPAPELTNEVWLNVDSPLRLADTLGPLPLMGFLLLRPFRMGQP